MKKSWKKNRRKNRRLHKKIECVRKDDEPNDNIQDLLQIKHEDNGTKTIEFQNAKIIVNIRFINDYKELGIDLSEQYLNELWNYHDVYYRDIQTEIKELMKKDLSYKSIFMKNGLGSIIYYNNQGEAERYFDNFIDFYNFVITNSNFTYGFENYHKQGIRVSRNKINFFGIQYLPLYDQMSWKNLYITQLLYWVKWYKKWEKTKAQKCYEDPYFKEKIGKISFHEYCQQKLKHDYFSIGYSIFCSKKTMESLRNRIEMDEGEYLYEIDRLLQRYSYNGKILFEKVVCLKDYKNSIGIYVLCLHSIRGIYIGQTRNSILDRIKAHWSNPSNDFDRTYGPNDVDEIYIIKVPEIHLNEVEIDCIASTNEKYILNRFRGGGIIDAVHSQIHRREDFLLDDEHLELIKKNILLEVEKV